LTSLPAKLTFSARYRLKVTDHRKLALGLTSASLAATGFAMAAAQTNSQGIHSAVGSVGGQSAYGFLRNTFTRIPRDPALGDLVQMDSPDSSQESSK
jgi:hypothetical protein